jgi:hypothetical protein
MEVAGRGSEVDGLTAVGGFRASSLDGIAGLLFAQPLTADRSQALPLADGEELANWATVQGELMLADWDDIRDSEGLMDGAGVVYACGGDTGKLPICLSAEGWLDAENLASWVRKKKEVLLIDTQFLRDSYRFVDEFKLFDSVLVVKEWSQPVSLKQLGLWPTSDPAANRWWRQYQRTLKGLAVNILAKLWCVSVDDVLLASEFTYADHWVFRDIGTAAGKELNESVDVIRRPGIAPILERRHKRTKRGK